VKLNKLKNSNRYINIQSVDKSDCFMHQILSKSVDI